MVESLCPVRGEVAAETAAGVQKAMRGSPGHSYGEVLMRSQECDQLPNAHARSCMLPGFRQLRTSRHFTPKEQYCSDVSKEIECRQTLIETILFLTLNHFSNKIFPGKEMGAGERRKKSRSGEGACQAVVHRKSTRQLYLTFLWQ